MRPRRWIVGLLVGATSIATADQIWILPSRDADVAAWRRAGFRVTTLGDRTVAVARDDATPVQSAERIEVPASLRPFALELESAQTQLPQGVQLLAAGDRLGVVALDPARLPEFARLEHLIELEPPPVGASPSGRLRLLAHKSADPAVKQAIVDAVDGLAMQAFDETLIDEVGDRYTYRIGDELAADHLEGVLESMGYPVSRQTWVQISPHVVHNIIAVKTGTLFPDEIVVVGAHYDATTSRDNDDGPALGAEDNGSGTSAVLHLADIFRDYATERTIHFVLFGMEEQNLYGSKRYVNLALGNGDDIVGALTMDMIAAWTNNYEMTIEGWNASHGDPGSFELMQLVDANVAEYSPDLGRKYYTPGFGSDHVPFHDAGIPAMLAIETDYAIYSGYHRLSDTLSNPSIHFETIAHDIVRGMAGALAELVGAHELGTAVQLGGFEATRLGDGVRLRWRFAGESMQLSLWRDAGVGSELLATLESQAGAMEYIDDLRGVEAGRLVYRLQAGDGTSLSTSFEYQTALALQWLGNLPNPFQASHGTDLRFVLAQRGSVRVDLYDVAGHRVRTLHANELEAGAQVLRWDGRDDGGVAVGAGIYFLRLSALNRQQTGRLVVLR